MCIRHISVSTPSGSKCCANRLSCRFVDARYNLNCTTSLLTGFYFYPKNPFKSLRPGHRSIIAEVVEVTVNDGSLSVDRVVAVIDAGYAVSPDGMKAQIESGIIYGLSAALYFEITIKDGAVAESNFHDYSSVRMSQAPIIETHIINNGEAMGGAGEPGTPPIAPALANAIFNATGKRIRQLPIKNTMRNV